MLSAAIPALLLSVLLARPARAQQPDSVAAPVALAAADYRPDTLLPVAATSLGRVLLTEFGRQPVLLLALPLPGRYAVSAVGYGHEQGEFRRAQDPTRARVTSLRTEGLRDWKGWRLTGRFEFERQWHDSVRWSLVPAPAPARPYYLAAPRPGNWDNSVYKLGTAGARRWLNGRLLTGLGLDLAAGNYVRTNDPRPEVLRYQLGGGASVGYQPRPAWLLALGYRYAYNSENGRVGFASQANTQGVNTPFTQYDVLGYGFLLTSRAGFYRVRGRQHGGQLSIRYAPPTGRRLLLLTAGASRQQQDFLKRTENNQTVTNGELAELIGTCTLSTFDAALSYFRESGPGRQFYQRLLLSAAQGQDRNNTFGLGNNYRYGQQQARLETGLLRRAGGGHLTEAAAGFYYQAERRADGTAAHRRQSRRAGLDLLVRRYQALPGAWRGIVGARAGAETDAGSSLLVPETQQNRFSRAVIFPDHAYDLQATLGGGLTLGLERAVAPAVRVRLLAEGGLLAPLTSRINAAYRPPLAPHGSRWDARISLRVFH